jgi:LacI family transcriptional regulator/LacI family repressor for deo operon, udp, cdd, tsx, nupC, and nupG
LELDEKLVREADTRSSEEAKEITLNLLDSEDPPTALFVTNNLMSLGALKAIKKLDFRIPEDISLIMYDDMPWATAMSPTITAVKQPGYEMGRRAGELFFQRVDDPDREIVEVKMEPKLMIRESSSRPNSAI